MAFPLQGSVTGAAAGTASASKPTAVVPPLASVPPPPPPTANSHPVAVVHPMPPLVSPQENVIDLPHDALAISFRCLREQVPQVQESINVRRDEIERRLGIIEQLWGSLTPPVQQKIYRLSQAVQRKSYNEAIEIYTSLVANHANECTSWAVTLRHIVLTIPPPQPAGFSSETENSGSNNTAILSRVQHI